MSLYSANSFLRITLRVFLIHHRRMTFGVAVQCALIVMVLLFIDVSSSCSIRLFQHSGHRGEVLAGKYKHIFPLSSFGHLFIYIDRDVSNGDHTCFNLPSQARDRASSVNTGGCCFILFSSAHCQGLSKKIGPGVPGCYDHGDLEDCNFNDQTKSYKRC